MLKEHICEGTLEGRINDCLPSLARLTWWNDTFSMALLHFHLETTIDFCVSILWST